MGMSERPSIRLRIDALVVEGLGPLPREALARTVEAELARRLAAGAVPVLPAGHRVRVDGGAFDVPARPRVADVGARIGQAVHRAVVHP